MRPNPCFIQPNTGHPQPWSLKKAAWRLKKVFEIRFIAHRARCMNKYGGFDKLVRVLSRSVLLLEKMREQVRYLHYSLQTATV